MSVTGCLCPLCNQPAVASSINGEMRARVYCESCTAFDITRLAFEDLSGSPGRRLALAENARAAPAGKVLVIKRSDGGPEYEARESKADRPAPRWLPAP